MPRILSISKSGPPLALAASLAAALSAGCATVRVPVHTFDDEITPEAAQAAPGESPARSPIAPMLELWLESSGQIPRRDQAQAAGEARGALAEVSYATQLEPHALGAEEPMLIVRERAVTRTSERKTDQTVATVAIVVGVVAVVVAVAVLAGKGGGGGGHLGALGGGAGHVASGAHAFPARGFAGAGAHLPPAHGHAWAPVGSIAVPGQRRHRLAFAPAELIDPAIDLAIEAGQLDELAEAQREREAEMAFDDPAPPPPPAEIDLPAMPELDPERGFFSGDDTMLELDLVDRATGRLLWSGAARKDIDPRDAEDLGRLYAAALGKQRWAWVERE